MKYTLKYDVWQDLVTGQLYTKEFAMRPIVGFDINGNTIKGYVYSPINLGWELAVDMGDDVSERETDYPVGCYGQNIFLTEEQLAIRFKYLGNVTQVEDIDKSIKEYSEDDCDFNNKPWLAKIALFHLARKNSGGLSQCIQAKILEFFLENALGDSEEELNIKKTYYNNEDKLNNEQT